MQKDPRWARSSTGLGAAWRPELPLIFEVSRPPGVGLVEPPEHRAPGCLWVAGRNWLWSLQGLVSKGA